MKIVKGELMKKKVLVMAGGDGIANPYINTIENKVSKHVIISALEEEHSDNKKIIERINNNPDNFFSVWGYSEKDSHLKKQPPKKGDYIFITYKNAAIYIARIFENVVSTKLDSIWAGRNGWKYKLLLQDVIRIFIPDPQNGSINSLNKKFDYLCLNNIFAPNLDSIKSIEKYYDSNIGFRNIIDKIDKYGNFQAAMYLSIDNSEMLKRLDQYIKLTHYECIIKVI